MAKPTVSLPTWSVRLSTAPGRRTYRAHLARAGRVRCADNSPGPFEIPAGALIDALDRGLFSGLACFVDHAGCFQAPSLRDLAGRVADAWWDGQAEAVDAQIRLLDTPAGHIVASLFDELLAAQATGEPVPDVGISLVFWPAWEEERGAGDTLVLRRFRHIESADLVFQPATDSRVLGALEALQALRPAQGNPPLPVREGGGQGLGPAADRSEPTLERRTNMTERPPDYGADQAPDEQARDDHPTDHHERPRSRETGPVADWERAARSAMARAMIDASGLPTAARQHLASREYDRPEQLETAIAGEREYLAALHADRVVQIGDVPPRGGAIAMGRTSLEQVTAALEALIAGTMPPAGVQPLSGLRELYHLLSGDYELHGVFQPDRVYLANVNSSTMAGIVANALNKRLVNAFQVYPRWWEPLCTIQDFSNLQQVKWITLGGIGELPTVAEGAAYTELTWDDQTETADFVKKGGYVGLTIEAIDKDDVGALRAAPRALAQAAWLSLSRSVSDIFTSNSGVGPTMSDSVALFHAANHTNLRTTALSWTEWLAVRIEMMKQTELNSGERLGALTAPRYLIVPIDLEITALQILASEGEPGGSDNDVNPLSTGDTHDARLNAARNRVIVCPLWTDTNNWAAAADPNLYPVIGLGFRYGRTPEIFSVASPTAGLMFTNDTMPIKVRFASVGPTDWRGLHKSNVADA